MKGPRHPDDLPSEFFLEPVVDDEPYCEPEDDEPYCDPEEILVVVEPEY